MTDFVLLALTLVAATNPPALAAAMGWPGAADRRTTLMAAVAGLTVFALAAGLAAGADDILDWMSIASESFRIAAGVVFLVEGARVLVFGPYVFTKTLGGWLAALIPIGFPLLLTPSLAAAAVTYGADEGVPETIGAIAIGIAAAVAATLLVSPARDDPGKSAFGYAARAMAALLIVFGVGLVVDGVRAI